LRQLGQRIDGGIQLGEGRLEQAVPGSAAA
jgi:hypothetical protein